MGSRSRIVDEEVEGCSLLGKGLRKLLDHGASIGVAAAVGNGSGSGSGGLSIFKITTMMALMVVLMLRMMMMMMKIGKFCHRTCFSMGYCRSIHCTAGRLTPTRSSYFRSGMLMVLVLVLILMVMLIETSIITFFCFVVIVT